MAKKRKARQKRSGGSALGRFFGGVLLLPLMAMVTYLGACFLLLVLYNVVTPPTTGVQIQRRVESFFEEKAYEKKQDLVSGTDISAHLRHAVVAAEDGRFYEHFGIDVEAVEKAIEENRKGRRMRGGSTITQQLVKNLFMTTDRSWLRKALEVPLALAAELLLPKERILTLYLNVIEWGRGVYGAEAAAQHYYGIPAARLTRYQAASLAALIPDPRRRSPQRMGWYTSIILRRMSHFGW